MAFSREPAIWFSGIAEILRMLVPMLIVFGVIHWTETQSVAFFAFSSVVLTFIQTLLTRSATTPTDRVDAFIREARRSPEDTSVKAIRAAVDAKDV